MQREPVTGVARLTLSVTVRNAKGKPVETVYLVRFLDPHPSVGYPAWRLTKVGKDGKASETAYNILLGDLEATCDCPDYEWRRKNQEKLCKHLEAAKAVGLLRRCP